MGLPIALAFAKKLSVIGFDINEERLDLMREGTDPSKELDASAFGNTDILFTSSVDVLKEASFYIVAVPTPVDDKNIPDLRFIIKASETVGEVMEAGNYVVFVSTL